MRAHSLLVFVETFDFQLHFVTNLPFHLVCDFKTDEPKFDS